ncbi:major facilitator superfamily domain-containing protein 1-like [Oppia nitens]|uniref:major facilitator superfamily domain-containing protein 1-like n=1 Tax=Oppia nitens TaxID=1686743 RepID=UPI0023DB827E|nr:major facilitator superfamily domain-containing protein 1-like [Oppia nitens]
MPPWRNRLARSAVNRKVGGSSPPGKSIGLTHPSHRFYRYSYLVLLCLLGTVFAWANIVINLISGYLIDKYLGIKLGTVLCCCFTVLGQLLLGVGAYVGKFWVMLLARLVFSLGSDTLTLIGYMRAIKWFPENELNFVFGMQLSVNRFGSTLNFIVMEPLYNYFKQYYFGHQCLGVVLMFVSLLPLMDLLLAIILAFLDTRAKKYIKPKPSDKNNDKIKLKDIINFSAVFPFISLGIPFYKYKFGFKSSQANLINSSIYFISIFASPVMGVLIGRFGRNLQFVLLSLVLTTISHLMLSFSFVNPWVAITVMGIAYSIFACIVWTLISFVVPKNSLGTAFGISQALINLILGLIDLAVVN